MKIYDVIEENEVIYIVIEKNEEINEKLDKLLNSEELDIKKEGVIQGHSSPITKNEIINLLNMDKSMCKIESKTKDNKKRQGSGFFCKLDEYYFPFKYALFTNNHILDDSNIDIGKSIKFECLKKSFFFSSYNTITKEIEITDKRRVYTNKELDYTCIELFESDGIVDFFEIDPDIFKYNINEILKNNDIFILQFPKGIDLSFSYGTIKSLKENIIMHNASTEDGSSGSPIIRRTDNNYVIGIHFGGKGNKKNKEDKENNKYLYNVATDFISIANDIKAQISKEICEINCIYIEDKNQNEINLLHDFNNEEDFDGNLKKEYLEVKNLNINLFKENIEIYVNEKKIKFEFKYKMEKLKEIKVKFKFNNRIMKKTSFMFYKCKHLKSIDLSSFNTKNVTNMSYMFYHCSSLNSIDLSSFNTNNVTNMSGMFYHCFSLNSIDLSSFNANNVTNMSWIFGNCSSLKSIDLSSFNTNNVTNMSGMFYCCSSLKSINLSKFNTNNVTDMSHMFYHCSSLNSIDLSSFNTNNVTNMSWIFGNCSSLNSIDLSKFNTNNITNMSYMFYHCSSLKSIDLSKINTNNVTDMSHMFNGCSSLIFINLSKINTNNVTNMSHTFQGCRSLNLLNCSKFNTNNVINMKCMFDGCSSLNLIYLSKFNTNNVTDMNYIFEGCSSLKANSFITDDKKLLQIIEKRFII